MIRQIGLVLGLTLLGSPAQAQPLNESLVECAVLVDALLGEEGRAQAGNQQVDFWIGFEEVLRTSAIQRAGQPYWDATAPIKRDTWVARWAGETPDHPQNMTETADWMDYCLSLADHLQL